MNKHWYESYLLYETKDNNDMHYNLVHRDDASFVLSRYKEKITSFLFVAISNTTILELVWYINNWEDECFEYFLMNVLKQHRKYVISSN